MNIIAIAFTLVCCLSMFWVKREQKVALLIVGVLILAEVRVPVIPLHKANMLLPAFYLLSEYKYLKHHLLYVWRMPALHRLLLLIIFSTLLCAVTTRYIGIWSLIRAELLFKYFALAYAFCATKNELTLKYMLRWSLWGLVVLTFFGIINLVEGRSEILNALTEGRTSSIEEGVALGDVGMEDDRFRVHSMFHSPFDYGYICAAMLLLHLHGFLRRFEPRWAFYVALTCSLFGIFASGCRTVWICSFMSVCCYYVWCFRPSRVVLGGMMVVVAFAVMYMTVPKVQEKVEQVTDIFSEHPDVKGSSLDMRLEQFAVVLVYIEGRELLGLGKGYYSTSYAENPDSVFGLRGVESVILSVLLERGVIGLIFWAVFYIWIFNFFLANRQRTKPLTGLGVSILALYVLFAVGTGELSSVYPSLLLLGFVMRGVDYECKGEADGTESLMPLRHKALHVWTSAEMYILKTLKSLESKIEDNKEDED